MMNYEYVTSVAGVTFQNEDDTNRQELIAKICNNDKQNEYKFVVTLKPTTFVNPQNVTEKAVAVYAGEDQLGFIPRKSIGLVEGMDTMVAAASYYKPADLYTIVLYKHEKPSSKQYSYVKRICNENKWSLPMYAKQDYTRFITAYQANNKSN